jgi:hypothetical protein
VEVLQALRGGASNGASSKDLAGGFFTEPSFAAEVLQRTMVDAMVRDRERRPVQEYHSAKGFLQVDRGFVACGFPPLTTGRTCVTLSIRGITNFDSRGQNPNKNRGLSLLIVWCHFNAFICHRAKMLCGARPRRRKAIKERSTSQN